MGSGLFSGNEIVSMAIQTEQSGYSFYVAASNAARSDEAKDLFWWLAAQEQNHEKTFREMLEDEKSHRPSEEYSGQQAEFIQTMLEARVLPDEDSGLKAVSQMDSDLAAVEFALGFEKDTILFMYEMRDVVSDSQRGTVDRLIAEEKSHVKRLSDMKRAMV